MKEQTLQSAIDKSLDLGANVVLLSPACASFDSFKNFEERGNVFKKIVKEIPSNESSLFTFKS